jgi:hypothetical protein
VSAPVKAVPLADVLGVMTGRPLGNPLALLDWMTGERPRPWAIASYSRRCRSALRVLHRDLAGARIPDFTDEAAVAAWAAEMSASFGPTRDIARLGAVPEQRAA